LHSGEGYEYPKDDERPSEVNEAQVAFMNHNERGSIDELKVQNEFLRSNLGKIVDTNQTLAESNKNMSQSTLILAELLNKKG